MKVCVDAGHGGRDPGAVAGGVRESEINLEVALRLERRLREGGLDVVMTRRKDRSLSLSARAAFANHHGADLFVSIHANAAASESVEGIETFHFPGSVLGNAHASAIQRHLVDSFPCHRDRGVREANFTVLRRTWMPAVLVELEFLTHPRQRCFLQAQPEALASAVARGCFAAGPVS